MVSSAPREGCRCGTIRVWAAPAVSGWPGCAVAGAVRTPGICSVGPRGRCRRGARSGERGVPGCRSGFEPSASPGRPPGRSRCRPGVCRVPNPRSSMLGVDRIRATIRSFCRPGAEPARRLISARVSGVMMLVQRRTVRCLAKDSATSWRNGCCCVLPASAASRMIARPVREIRAETCELGGLFSARPAVRELDPWFVLFRLARVSAGWFARRGLSR